MKKPFRYALVLDMDGTLTPADTIFQLFERLGKRPRAEQVYKWSKTRPDRIAREFGVPESRVFPGMDAELVLKETLRERDSISASCFERVAGVTLYPGARRFVRRLALHYSVTPFIATASYSPVALSIARRLGIAEGNVGATRLLLDADGNAVSFVGPVMEGAQKEDFVRTLGKKLRIPLRNFIGVGDSPSDLPFLLAIKRSGGMVLSVKKKPEFSREGIPVFRKDGRPDFAGMEKRIVGWLRAKKVMEK